ncbi:putative subtilisin-like protease precursor [Conidiobolus coronatus NRRL 28638]|uniref:Putative subtilisin-like protease n=1 Tax=Conidiobolus coronatus (strain ATCC 28846 / CBS 209.66 / NRRL 28638) TaxID=796925 RepID=A0A137P9S5_CONC2|nr:putative subtilisin-like protease precursor [Conidiobolus coronatus NRRL 28638]|eukprot:KXN71757.1 putative subtilisin-like protease precursor [Conidiobolus coronatus NRRL 28638]
MQFATVFATFTFLVASLVQGQTIPGQYIVSFDNKSRSSFESNVQAVQNLFTSRDSSNVVLQKYDAVFNGISAKLDKATLEKVKALPNVEYIEEDAVVKTLASQSNAPWGLARVSQRPKLGAAPHTYLYDANAGDGVNIYVLDTGLNIAHVDFTGRASWGTTTSTGTSNTDLHGHGTHCAGSAAGTTYGVAKKAKIIAVKVLGDNGSGTLSETIAGINWVVKNKSGVKGNVISMSLGGNKNVATNQAVNDAVAQGVITVVAAGNSNADACNFSPASADKAITVGSIDINDNKASSSNWGPCVDIHGPGVNILSAWKGSTTASNTISGTSMATPHIAGLVATLLSQGVPTSDVENKLKSIATLDKIQGLPANTVNLLGYNGIN